MILHSDNTVRSGSGSDSGNNFDQLDDFKNPAIESATDNPNFIRQRRLHSKPHPGKCWSGKQLRSAQVQIEVRFATYISFLCLPFPHASTW